MTITRPMSGTTSRPTSAVVAGWLLVLVAFLAGASGVLMTLVSGCCGSSEPADSRPLLGGLLVAACSGGAASVLLAGGSASLLLAAAAVPPAVAALLAVTTGVDFFLPAVVLVVFYALLVRATRRDGWRRWLDDGGR